MARKRKRDKEDEELAREIAKVAGVTRYMQQVTEEDIKKQGDLYLKYASGMMGFGPQVLQDSLDENGSELTVMAREISVDDEYVSGDNKHYVVPGWIGRIKRPMPGIRDRSPCL